MKENIKSLKLETIIYLLESPDSNAKYTDENLLAELAARNVPKDAFDVLVFEENNKIARLRLENDTIGDMETHLHKSHFLSEDDVREIYIDQMEYYMSYKDGFRFDVWAYAIGGMG